MSDSLISVRVFLRLLFLTRELRLLGSRSPPKMLVLNLQSVSLFGSVDNRTIEEIKSYNFFSFLFMIAENVFRQVHYNGLSGI